MKQEWIIPTANTGARLDVFLAEQITGKTRSAIAKLLKSGAATVNGKPASVHHFLKTGDKVIFDGEKRIAPKTNTAVKHAKPSELPRNLIPQIIDETPDWMVINKPAGLLVHPDKQTQDGTLVDFLVKYFPPIAKIGEDPSRPGIMHRLDKEVGGLMVIAKTQDAYDNLKRQFAEHSVDKEYLALVHGELPQDQGDIKFRIARSKSKARMAARPEGEKVGKAAWTFYKVKQKYTGATLLELRILSGRTHQIRAHMHGLGHPVIGDTLYKIKQTDRNIESPRLLLQSVSLSFIDPTSGEKKSYSLPRDPAFDDMIEKL